MELAAGRPKKINQHILNTRMLHLQSYKIQVEIKKKNHKQKTELLEKQEPLPIVFFVKPVPRNSQHSRKFFSMKAEHQTPKPTNTNSKILIEGTRSVISHTNNIIYAETNTEKDGNT